MAPNANRSENLDGKTQVVAMEPAYVWVRLLLVCTLPADGDAPRSLKGQDDGKGATLFFAFRNYGEPLDGLDERGDILLVFVEL